jgi:hypothetical protein
MQKLTFTAAGALLAALLQAAPAHAQATRTWVSGVGDDVNPCSRTAPCKTFQGAISKTATNGIINCLDPGGFGAVTITKSLTIDCHEIPAGITTGPGNGIVINLTTTLTADPLQTVRLRNLNIDGTTTSTCSGVSCGIRGGTRGVSILNAAHVFLDDMMIQNFANEGVRDARTTAGGGKLYIRNSLIRDNAGVGILVAGTGGVQAVVENSAVHLNNFGIAVAASNSAMVTRSTFTGNNNGVEADASGSLSVDDSTISSNTTGVVANAGSTVRLSNNNIAFNGTGINGATTSFGNNRIYPNVGTAPTVGAASTDHGQQ